MYFKQFIEQEQTDVANWLGASTVQHPVYHGTNANFQQFQKMKTQRGVLFSMWEVQSQGFFFSESKEDAQGYGKKIITAYIRLMNPLVDPRRNKHLAVDRLPKEKEVHIAYILRNLIKKDPHYGKYIDMIVNRVYVPHDSARRRMPSEWIYRFLSSGGLVWDVLDEPTVVATMKKLGYDGTFVSENEDSSGRSIFVMNPEQIKIVSVGY